MKKMAIKVQYKTSLMLQVLELTYGKSLKKGDKDE
jgi:hypothetical protein